MSRIGLLLILSFLTGCAEKKQARVIVPKQCLGPITITDFTKSCKPTGSDTATCDGVKIKYHCVEYPKP